MKARIQLPHNRYTDFTCDNVLLTDGGSILLLQWISLNLCISRPVNSGFSAYAVQRSCLILWIESSHIQLGAFQKSLSGSVMVVLYALHWRDILHCYSSSFPSCLIGAVIQLIGNPQRIISTYQAFIFEVKARQNSVSHFDISSLTFCVSFIASRTKASATPNWAGAFRSHGSRVQRAPAPVMRSDSLHQILGLSCCLSPWISLKMCDKPATC